MNSNERTAFISIKTQKISIIPAPIGESYISQKSLAFTTKLNVILVAQVIIKQTIQTRARNSNLVKKPKSGRKLHPADYSERLSKIQRTFIELPVQKEIHINDLPPSPQLNTDGSEFVILETPQSPKTQIVEIAPFYSELPYFMTKGRKLVCQPHSEQEAAALRFVAQSFSWFKPEEEDPIEFTPSDN